MQNFLEIFKIEFICLQGSCKLRKMLASIHVAPQDPKGIFEERISSVGSKGCRTFTDFFFFLSGSQCEGKGSIE